MDLYRYGLEVGGDTVKRVVVGRDELFGPWLCSTIGITWIPGRGSTIGLWDDVKCVPLAAVMYDSFNGASIVGHLVGSGRKWMTRDFLWFCFYYPFEQLGVNKIIGPVPSDNYEARRLDEHLGFTLEATLKDAAPKGDLLLYSMTKEQCRWLSLRKYSSEQTRPAAAA